LLSSGGSSSSKIGYYFHCCSWCFTDWRTVLGDSVRNSSRCWVWCKCWRRTNSTVFLSARGLQIRLRKTQSPARDGTGKGGKSYLLMNYLHFWMLHFYYI